MRLGLSPFKSQSVASVETPGFLWTTFTEHASTRKVYVSAAGNDANDGLTELTPKLTIAAGGALIRDGYPDWLLLRRGDTFANQTLSSVSNKGGLDAANKLLISSYGSGARPIIDCNAQAWSNSSAKAFIAFTSIEVAILSRTPGEDYLAFQGFGGHDILFEDVSIHDMGSGFGFQESGGSGRPADHVFRRCQVYDIYTSVGGGIGIYTSKCDGFVFDECVIDYCGWHAGAGSAATFHNTYFQNDCGPLTFRNCTSARGPNESIMARCGGWIDGNLFMASPNIAALLSGNNVAAYATTRATFNDNVCIESRFQNLADVHGNCLGVDINGSHHWDFKRNIIAHNTLLPIGSAGPLRSWSTYDGTTAYGTRGVTDCTFDGNIQYKWHGQVRLANDSANPAYFSDIEWTNNKFHEPYNETNSAGNAQWLMYGSGTFDASVTFANNTYYSLMASPMKLGASTYSFAAWNTLVGDTTSVSANISGSYPNPDADIGDYLASIGETNANVPWTDIDTLMGLMRVNHKGSWNDAHSGPAVRDWFRANFGLAPV